MLPSETIPPPFPRTDLAQFIKTRSLRLARAHLVAMDSAVKAFLDKLETTLTANTGAIRPNRRARRLPAIYGAARRRSR